ncbi:MAG: HAD-IIB family hydrolase [Betaproteobacteria bacterium]|nr:HAD-IIB family hydrolase [Betaproteobacteria bacterium]
MKALAEFPVPLRRQIRNVLCDIDDTLTSDGRLTAAAYTALESLHHAGLRVIPVTGRPAGWCDHIARMWPVDGVVGENGAFYFRYDHAAQAMRRRYAEDDATREANRTKLSGIGARIIAAVPGCAISADQHYREADLAIDFCEDVPRLADDAIAQIVALMQESGLTAKISSIHVNGWFGSYDKLGMTKTLFAECFGIDLDKDGDETAFIGDSPNDAPMFAFFKHAVGVANVQAFAGRLDAAPAWVTREKSGAGFCEFAAALLAAR